MTDAQTAPAPRDRILDRDVELQLASGKTIQGSLEYFPSGKSLVVLDEDGLEPSQLTVTAAEAPEIHRELAPDQVLLRNWTDHRGAPKSLAEKGFVELVDETVTVGMFRLNAVVARVL
jgi:hypothetical protein